MAAKSQPSREEIKRELLAFELTERRFALASQAVLLVIAVASAVTTMICVLSGYHWPTPSATSGPGIASTIGLVVAGRRKTR